ncbi:MAG: hypothetical protein M5U19_03435 [Microthrixaceae bacterium]|nr:hypothetical protein [Microthrixaceae bacterium]
MKPFVRVGVPVVLTALAALGLWLVLTSGSGGAGSDGADQDDGRSRDAGSEGTRSEDFVRLDIDGTDMDSVSGMAGLSLPAGTTDFLSARMDDDSQLDVTFTIAHEDEAAFLDASRFPEPRADQRVITHASPLWDLNVEGTIRGVADTAGDVDAPSSWSRWTAARGCASS